MKSGIYIFTNKVNQKCYIGSAANLTHRRGDHLSMLRNNKHHSVHFQRAFNKHGEDNFIWSVLERVQDKGNLILKEQYYIDLLSPEYNICKIAGSSIGLKRSEETCKKIGLAKIGNTNWLGKSRPKETRDKISKSLQGNTCKRGTKVSDQARINITKGNMCKIARLGTTKYGSVDQILNDKVINTFKDAYEASVAVGKTRHGGCKIIRACKQNIKAYSFKWKFSTKSN